MGPSIKSKAKMTIAEITDRGHFENHYQSLRLEYMRGVDLLKPACIVSLSTTEARGKPISYRTNSPEKMRMIIKGMIKMLHRLESDINAMGKRGPITSQ